MNVYPITFQFHSMNNHILSLLSFENRQVSSLKSEDMWQSRVEIEHYSIVYFDRITVFKTL